MNDKKALKAPVSMKYITVHLVLTGIIGLLFAFNSIAGMAFPEAVYPTAELYSAFLPNDYVNLFLGVPALILSAVLALRGAGLGLIGWAAGLMFILYNDIAYLFAVRSGFAPVTGAAVAALCILQLALMLATLSYSRLIPDTARIRRPWVYGVIVIVMGLVFVGRALMNIISAANGSTDLPLPELAVNVADLAICALWLAGGILLFTKTKLGFAAGLMSYLHGSLLFLALLVFMAIQPALAGTEFVAADLAVIFGMSLVFWVPSALLARAAVKRGRNACP